MMGGRGMEGWVGVAWRDGWAWYEMMSSPANQQVGIVGRTGAGKVT